MDRLEIIEKIIELKECNKILKEEIKKIKESQNNIVSRLDKLIKKTNNMCFVYSSDSENDCDILYNLD